MRKLFVLLGFITGLCGVQAQEVSVANTTEQLDTASLSKLGQRYEALIMAEREELTLIKLDLLGPFFFGLSNMDTTKHNVIRLTYEQKFKPEWSWLAALEAQATRQGFTEWRYRGGLRYYFNMDKRILKGKSANNFSANYVSPRLNYKHRPEGADSQVSLDLLFGIQRRLWKYGYLDFDIGFENIFVPFDDRQRGLDLTSSIQIGIAF